MSQAISLSGLNNELSAEELSELDAILSAQQFKLHKNRIHVASFFYDWDAARTGTVTKPQFSRVIALIGFKISHSIVELLNKAYEAAEDKTRVNYKLYLQHLEQNNQTGNNNGDNSNQIPFNNPAAQASFPAASLSLDSVLSRVRSLVYLGRKDVSDLFNDFDPLRKCKITVQQFRRCLDLAELQLSDAELNVLAENYGDSEGFIRYRDFVATVEAAFFPHNAEKQPTQLFTPLQTSHSADSSHVKSRSEPVNELLSSIGYLTYTRRLLIKPSFAHFDRAHHGLITDRQFVSVLGSLFPNQLQQADYQLLASHYTKANSNLANYQQFVADVAQAENDFKQHSEAKSASIGSAPQHTLDSIHSNNPHIAVPSHVNIHPSARPLHDFSSLVQTIRVVLAKNRVNVATLRDQFYQYDPLHHGYITATRFYRCLLTANLKKLPVDHDSVQLLVDNYPSSKSEGDVDYIQFLNDLDPVQKI
jgi:Ca2+-binding EF-hand superfamily protein